MQNGLFVAVYDVNTGDEGLVPGSHKSIYHSLPGILEGSQNLPFIIQVTG